MNTLIDIFLHDRVFGRTLSMRCATAVFFGAAVFAGTWFFTGSGDWTYSGIAAVLGLVASRFGNDATVFSLFSWGGGNDDWICDDDSKRFWDDAHRY